MTLHITVKNSYVSFQRTFYVGTDDKTFLQLAHIVITKMTTIVPKNTMMQLYMHQFPLCMIPHKFASQVAIIMKDELMSRQNSTFRYWNLQESMFDELTDDDDDLFSDIIRDYEIEKDDLAETFVINNDDHTIFSEDSDN